MLSITWKIYSSFRRLIALVSFTIDRRMKEIGIRKVLGASIVNIFFIVSKESIKYIGLAILIASPIALFAVRKWLVNYTYRVDIKPEIFIGAGAIALVIAILSIRFQSIKAAIQNPVNSLKNE